MCGTVARPWCLGSFMSFEVLFAAVAYLFGSISSAVIVSKLMGLPDPRSEGSKNPGTTNVLRLGGKKAAIFTLLGDSLKGVVPVLIARYFGASDSVLAVTALFAFLGHLYPVFFGFKGGKGVATALGVLLALAWPVGLAALGVWISVAFASRISSLSALTAAVLTPIIMWWVTGSDVFVALNLFLSLVLIWRHRSNVRNILNGTEGRIGAR